MFDQRVIANFDWGQTFLDRGLLPCFAIWWYRAYLVVYFNVVGRDGVALVLGTMGLWLVGEFQGGILFVVFGLDVVDLACSFGRGLALGGTCAGTMERCTIGLNVDRFYGTVVIVRYCGGLFDNDFKGYYATMGGDGINVLFGVTFGYYKGVGVYGRVEVAGYGVFTTTANWVVRDTMGYIGHINVFFGVP